LNQLVLIYTASLYYGTVQRAGTRTVLRDDSVRVRGLYYGTKDRVFFEITAGLYKPWRVNYWLKVAQNGTIMPKFVNFGQLSTNNV